MRLRWGWWCQQVAPSYFFLSFSSLRPPNWGPLPRPSPHLDHPRRSLRLPAFQPLVPDTPAAGGVPPFFLLFGGVLPVCNTHAPCCFSLDLHPLPPPVLSPRDAASLAAGRGPTPAAPSAPRRSHPHHRRGGGGRILAPGQHAGLLPDAAGLGRRGRPGAGRVGGGPGAAGAGPSGSGRVLGLQAGGM